MMAEHDLKPDLDEIECHLAHITARWGEIDIPCMLETRMLTNEDRAQVKDVQRFKPTPEGIADAAKHLTAMNAYKLNCYVVVNPIRADAPLLAGKAAKDGDIAGSFFHWADADDQQAADNIKSFVGPRPTFAVLTGTTPSMRPHVYWELEEPTMNLAAWRITQEAIVGRLNTDSTVVNASRIMRVGGTVNWPKPQKIGRGYIAEKTQLHIHSPDDRPAVTSERMARAFAGQPAAAPVDGFQIATGDMPAPLDRERTIIKALSGEEWNLAVFKLVGSYVRKGLSDSEVHALTDPLTLAGYTVGDTRDEVQTIIERTRKNPSFEGASQTLEARPLEVTSKTISDFKIDNSQDFLSDLQPLEYLIDGLLPMGVTYSLTGHAGHGKTTLALQFAISLAQGERFGDRETSKGRVLILAGENPYNVKWQYAAALSARNIKPQDIDINFVQGRFSIAQWADVLRSKMEAMPDLKLVIVDSLQAFFEGDNDNDNTQMVEMAHKLRDLCETTRRPAILIIAHPAGKIPAKDNLVPRGGGAFLNEIDGNLTVWSQDSSQQTLHHSQKFRGAGFDPMEWVMQIHEFSHLTDIHGTPLKLPVSRPEMAVERANREVQTEDYLRQFLDLVGQGQSPSEREGATRFRISRHRMRGIIETAKSEKLIKRYAKTYKITDGGRDFLEAQDAGI